MRPAAARLLLALGLAAASLPAAAQTYEVLPPASPQTDPYAGRIERARAHLEALSAGRLTNSQLTAQELQDVLDLERRVRARGADNRSTQQKCVDTEVRRTGGQPSRLDWEVIRLKCR